MKKLLFILPTLSLLFACSSDDSSSKSDDIKPTIVEWIPNKIDLGNALINVYSFDYPHSEGCELDFIRLLNNTSAIFFEHEETTCKVIETEQAFQRSGNEVKLVLLDTEVNGKIVTENNTEMVIEADASQFTDIILEMNPEFSEYVDILNTLKIKINFNKK